MPKFIHIPVSGDIEIIEADGEEDGSAKIKAALNDGWLELMPYTVLPDMAMMVDEEGQSKNLPPNLRATALQSDEMGRNVILGSAVLIGRQGPDLQSCPDAAFQLIEMMSEVGL